MYWKDIQIEREILPVWKLLLNGETNHLKLMLGEDSDDWTNLQEAIRQSSEPLILRVRQQKRQKSHWKDVVIERTLEPVWDLLLNDERNMLQAMLGEGTEDWLNLMEAVQQSRQPIVLRIEQQVRD